MSRADELRVVHYINQFFAGIGGEELADTRPSATDGPVGPGRLLERRLDAALQQVTPGRRAHVTTTLVCGDNAINESMEEVSGEILDLLDGADVDLFVAGPAFGSGRYGLACAALCQRVQARFGIPALTAMHPDNPGVTSAGPVYVVPTTERGSGMGAALDGVAKLAVEMLAGTIGPAEDSGYLPRGIRKVVETEPRMSAAKRAVEMALRKVGDRPVGTELPIAARTSVSPPANLVDLGTATIALVTEGGIVPRGNPDRIEAARATVWARYGIDGVSDLLGDDYESIHGGYDNTWVNSDPDRMLPVDALRTLEADGIIGRLHEEMFVTCGSVGAPAVMRRIGAEMAEDLVSAGVTGVILPAT